MLINPVGLVHANKGICMPQIDMEDEPESLGLRLMRGLSVDFDVVITFEVDNGTRITIVFERETRNDPEKILKVSEKMYV